MSAERPTCKSCIYWDGGYCRSQSPKQKDGEAAWPYSQPTDWCGEHQDFIKWMHGLKEVNLLTGGKALVQTCESGSSAAPGTIDSKTPT